MTNLVKRKKDIERKEKIEELMLKHPEYCLHDIQKELKMNINHVERYYMMIKRSWKNIDKKMKMTMINIDTDVDMTNGMTNGEQKIS